MDGEKMEISNRVDGEVGTFVNKPDWHVREQLAVRYRDDGEIEMISLGIRESYIVKRYLEMCGNGGVNYEEIARRVSVAFGKKVSGQTIERWIERRPLLREHIKNGLIYSGVRGNWSEEKYKMACIMSLSGGREYKFPDGFVMRFNKSTAIYLKLLGEVLGYTYRATFKAEKMQVNFVQGNGKR